MYFLFTRPECSDICLESHWQTHTHASTQSWATRIRKWRAIINATQVAQPHPLILRSPCQKNTYTHSNTRLMDGVWIRTRKLDAIGRGGGTNDDFSHKHRKRAESVDDKRIFHLLSEYVTVKWNVLGIAEHRIWLTLHTHIQNVENILLLSLSLSLVLLQKIKVHDASIGFALFWRA